jgi:hypothetical protein
MGSAKKMIKKVGKAVGVGGGQKAADTVAMAEIATDTSVKSMTDELSAAQDQTKAQTGAAAARKKRGGRVGQRGLLYASRLGGRGGGRGDTQDTLGSA